MSKVLIVYYTFSGATEKLAAEIARQTGGDLRKLIPEKAYSFNYNTATKEVRSEIEKGFCPRLLSGEAPVEQYDAIFIGSPNWFKHFAPPVLSFVRHVDLTGKTVGPFCTSGGGGLGEMIEDFTKECSRSQILPGFAAAPDFPVEKVSEWLKRIGLYSDSSVL